MSQSDPGERDAEVLAATAGEPEPAPMLEHFNPCDGEVGEEFRDWGEPAWTFVEGDAGPGEMLARWITIAQSDCVDRRAWR